MKRTAFAAILLVALTAQTTAAQPRPRRPVDRPFGTVVAPLAAATAAEKSPAVVVGVMHRGRVLHEAAYGTADIASSVPAWSGMPMQIGSITKQMTAAGILRLQEQGALDIDDDVKKWIPELDTRGHAVTLRHLLTHTSGVPEFLSMLTEFWQPITVERVISLTNSGQWQFAPGARFSYNNTGYWLLGLVIDRASGRAWGEFLRTELFLPAGMTETGICGEPPLGPAPVGYIELAGGRRMTADPVDMTIPGAAGAICSTAGDLLRWTHALTTNRILSEASFNEMRTPATLGGGDGIGYGLGLSLGSARGGRHMIGHGGSIFGFQSSQRHDIEGEFTVIVLTNISPQSGAPPAELSQAIYDAWRRSVLSKRDVASRYQVSGVR